MEGDIRVRVSEIVGLQWQDFDFENQTVLVQRGVVHGYVGDVKTEYSKDHLPLDPLLVDLLGQHRERCYPTAEGWLFANPATGKPYHQEQIQKRHIRPAGVTVGIDGDIGWHTFRHTVGTVLAELGEHQLTIRDYLRHSNLSVTNKYLQAASNTKRKAQDRLVDAILPTHMRVRKTIGAVVAP